ncbi:MAG: sugar kinase [Pseudomarimonas sp.]
MVSARIVLVTRHSRLDDLIARFNTIEQARFYVQHLGADFADYEAEHRTYQQALKAADAALSLHGRVQRLDRSFLPNFLFPPDAIVVVLGQDGLVANTLKYLRGQPVIGVNPDPARWDGVLLPYTSKNLGELLPELLAGRCAQRGVSFARVRLSDGQELLGVNDLFIGPRSHTSARYEIAWEGRQEAHSSSGVIVSTGLGSTGWFRSLLTGASGIAGDSGNADFERLREHGFAWDAEHLYFTVREPFPSRQSRTDLVFGQVHRGRPLRLVSQMAGYGVIFSDGIEADFLEFNAGMTAEIDVAEQRGCLVA